MSSTDDRKTKCLTFNIQKYSVHDGPGIRTVVFLKGCPLRCAWCSNPESQEPNIQLAYNEGRCIGLSACSRCVEACTAGAISRGTDDHIAINRSLCTDYPLCTKVCPSHALIPYGEWRTVEEILRTVEEDGQFYARSGGGMTLSGGEPLFQSAGALALLREAKRHHINTAIETCGQVPWEVLKEACGLLHSILFDLKHPDPERHKAGTGVVNTRILSNFRNMLETYPDLPVLVRTPVIPGFNASEEAIGGILDILEPYPQVSYQLLPYHRLGTQKYRFLDRTPPMGEVRLDDSLFERLQTMVAIRRQSLKPAVEEPSVRQDGAERL